MKTFFRSSLLIVIATLLPVISGFGSVSAVSGSEWRAGRIIDDGVFMNGSDMTVGEIQAFLNSKVGTGGYASVPGQCDNQGSLSAQPYSSATRAEYARSLGRLDKFTCLNGYYEVPKTSPGAAEPASNYGGAPIPAGAQSAAQIIANAAIKYNINPKVLLVKLATESAGPLTSDDWPFKKQYLYAMGAHCPDSGPGGAASCDVNWSGFSLQMDEAASLLRWYLDSMTQSWWQYKKPYQNNNILWNVAETGCGGSNVYIETKATAALYTYTPYQPNQAALNNMYGTGDGCSAYGNRNFWRVWNDWFGSPLSPSYVWQVQSQYAYADSSKAAPIGLDSLKSGQRAYIGLSVKNIGSATWLNSGPNPVRLGTSRPSDRASAFYDPTWLGYGRPAALNEASVAPGETGTFEFWITAPEVGQATNYNEYFTPLAEAKAWMPDIGLYYAAKVQPMRYTWDLVSQYAYADATKTVGTGLFGIEPGQRKYVGLVIKNTGNVTWSNSGNNPLKLGTTHNRDRASSFADPSWLSPTRPALMKEVTVAPGQNATFEFWFKAPDSKYGSFSEYFSPVLEAKAWLQDIGLNYSGSVMTPKYSWQLMSQYAHSDAGRTAAIGLGNLTPGQVVYVGFTAKNTGNITWRDSSSGFPVRVGTSNPNDRNSSFCENSWLSCTRPTSMKEAAVAPGETGTFEFSLKAPNQTGDYREYFNILAERRDWSSNINFNYFIRVQ